MSVHQAILTRDVMGNPEELRLEVHAAVIDDEAFFLVTCQSQ